MKIIEVDIKTVKENDDNPRIIRDDNFKRLVKSIIEFPEMLKIRPIVVNSDMVVLGGNMRLKACKSAGLKTIPIIMAGDMSEEKQREFIIKDNVSGGEWDWSKLANEWSEQDLDNWGLDVWQPEPELDYGLLDDIDDETESTLDTLEDNVKKAIMIEFDIEHYQDAYDVVKFWREQGAYVGKMILDYLKSEKDKL